MIKEIRTTNTEKGIVQITTIDERWYAFPSTDKKTGLPIYDYVPSVTWIADYYPKGIGFYKWLADKGWDEAESIKIEAGNKGSKVHKATEIIDSGGIVKLEDRFLNPKTGQEEELTVDEFVCIKSFVDWLDEYKPELIASEITVIGKGYAGTIDRIYLLDGVVWIVDLKTSSSIWPSHQLQISAYSHADIDLNKLGITQDVWDKRKLGILQLGYWRNKNKYKFTEIEDEFDMFQVAQKIWARENKNSSPKQIELPLEVYSIARAVSKGN